MSDILEFLWNCLKFPYTMYVDNMQSSWTGWVDWVLYGFLVLIWAFGVFMVVAGIWWVIDQILYKRAYGSPKHSDGTILGKHHYPGYYTTTMAGKTPVTTYHPPRDEVTFKTEQGTSTVDSDELFDIVKRNEHIVVYYQDRYYSPRFWEGEWEHEGYRLLKIEDSQHDCVAFNNAKAVLPELSRRKN